MTDTYGMNDSSAELYAYDSKFTGKSSRFKVRYHENDYEVETRLAGRFNIYNTLGAIGAALNEGISMDDAIEAVKDFQSVPGRFELIDEGQSFAVVVSSVVLGCIIAIVDWLIQIGLNFIVG